MNARSTNIRRSGASDDPSIQWQSSDVLTMIVRTRLHLLVPRRTTRRRTHTSARITYIITRCRGCAGCTPLAAAFRILRTWTCRLFPVKNVPPQLIPSPSDDYIYQRNVVNRRRGDAAAAELPLHFEFSEREGVGYFEYPVKSVSQSVSHRSSCFIMLNYYWWWWCPVIDLSI